MNTVNFRTISSYECTQPKLPEEASYLVEGR